jgi:uncharacterized protein (UPF0332 family)
VIELSLEKLLKDRVVRKIRIDKNLVQKTFSMAKRDLETAKRVLDDESYSWSLAIAYNSMLQAGRALMFSKGFKPSGEYKHVAVVRFLHEIFGKELTDRLITIFDRVRKKRHKVVYDEPDVISEYEAENAVLWASEFLLKVEDILKRGKFI